jgi:hypothetical protein
MVNLGQPDEVIVVNPEDFKVMDATEGEDVFGPMPSQFARERRVKILPVGEQQVLTLAYMLAGDTPQFVAIPRMPNLPEGTKIEGVYHDFDRRSFLFLLSHPSFEPVMDGEPSPYVDKQLWTQYTAHEVEHVPKKRERTAGDLGGES